MIAAFRTVLFSVVMGCAAAAAGASTDSLSVESLVKQMGVPIVITSGFEKGNKEKTGSQISFYSVIEDPRTIKLSEIQPGRFLVFSTDPLFAERAAQHFESFNNPKSYTGSTMYSSLWRDSISIVVFKSAGNGRFQKDFESKVSIVYLYCARDREELRKEMALHPTARKPPSR